MTVSPSDYVPIARTFRDLSNEEVADIEKASALARYGWRGGISWGEVLRSPRVLLISEAGVGKTRECREQRDRLVAAGEPAFFFDLATLANVAPREMLLPDEEARFDAWLASQSDVATFFLDSIDELKLTLGSFETALKRFAKALGGQIARARIVVTTRPIPFDRTLIQRVLPIPSTVEAVPTAEGFADMMMERRKNDGDSESPDKPRAWRNVGLMPLSQEQRRQFAVGQGISDPDALLADINSRDAEEFAGRPQDLIELCADWRDHRRIRSHRDQVETNVATKLKPRSDPQERTQLSQEKAIEGASRLALAAMLTRKLTLRYNAESDRAPASEPALDVSKILLDWDVAAQAALLERPLFGFASYGRVRFHHRSVVEFLAAKRLDALLTSGAAVAYQHIRNEDDAQHEGSYSPDTRDNAERARNAILGALFAATGPDGWQAKLEMASDPLFAHLKDRTLALAGEKSAEEADATPLTEGAFTVLDKIGEAPPATRDAMFALMRDRLDDLDDLLLQDVSPREAWAAIKDERVMRRELARTLRDWSRSVYTVDQEAVTADEKETDIRLRSTVSSQQATIELKLADDRSGRDLFDTLRKQLLSKYMAADDCRAGCLLVTIAKDREWEHPITGKNIDFPALICVLNYEADTISRELGGTAMLVVKGLNLRPRLA